MSLTEGQVRTICIKEIQESFESNYNYMVCKKKRDEVNEYLSKKFPRGCKVTYDGMEARCLGVKSELNGPSFYQALSVTIEWRDGNNVYHTKEIYEPFLKLLFFVSE